MAPKIREIYQFKVTLIGISRPVWRRILVWGDSTLAKLHRVLQVAMGWENYHLYTFRIEGKLYGPADPDEDDGWKPIDAKRMRLPAALRGVGTTSRYVYDLGDNWQHDLLLEAILMPVPGSTYPQCIAGERSCPPEDAGSYIGYRKYLEAMADPNHEQHEEMMLWRGPFDPEAFSLEKVNLELQKKFPSARKTLPLESLAPPRSSAKHKRMSRELVHLTLPPRRRISIRPNETVPLELNQRERELILSHTFAEPWLTDRLQVLPQPSEQAVFHFTWDDLDQLANSVAAEANHAKNKVLTNQLDELYDRIEAVLNQYKLARL